MKLLFVALIDGRRPPDALEEESVRVVFASDSEEAAKRGTAVGSSSSHRYTNEAGQLVEWTFLGTVAVQDLGVDELSDGCEVFSTLRRSDPLDS